MASLACATLVAPVSAQETLLQNDGFVDGQPAVFQGGFVAGEMAASRLVPSGVGPWRVNRVRFLFGGATSMHTITLRIYDDTAGTTIPGTELYFADYIVTGSDNQMQEIVLTGENIQVTGAFRVALQFTHAGFPCVARDADGTITATRNFIFTPSVWFQSSLAGLTGDWIIRAGVEPVTGGGDDPPQILSVLDVGNDQGKQVRVRFQRSDQDAPGATTPISNYEIFRRIDPLSLASGRFTPPGIALLDGWDYVASLPAHGENIYSMVVPTLADSTLADGMHWSVFLVRAATAAPLTFFDSAPDSGYSLDNLAPAPPASLVHDGGQLSWLPAPETDFDYYTVYGSNVATFGPASVLLDRTSTTGFAVPGNTYRYYFVTVTDFAGNEGAPATVDLGAPTDALAPALAPALALRVAPNPFNPTTVISFDVHAPGHVRLDVYRADGRLVRTLRNEHMTAGSHRATWDGRDSRGDAVGSGGYIARLEAEGRTSSSPLRLIR